MTLFKKVAATFVAGAAVSALSTAALADTITLHGATQFDDEHAFNRTLLKFEELVKECYDGEHTLEFVLHRNRELGVEKDYFNFMSQGLSVDYAVVAPSHMTSFVRSAALMDMPFLFRDLDHWNAVLESDAFKPIEEATLADADVLVLGYAGGGTRNLISDKPIDSMDTLVDHKMRVMGAPIQAQIFDAVGAAPSALAYDETYNAIQTGVVSGLENEAAGLEQMKFYEVAPHVSLTQHAITVRPLLFSNKTFERLPDELQQCIVEAGAEAGKYGREIESGEDQQRLDAMKDKGLIEVHEFAGREQMLEQSRPAQDDYAESIGASDVLETVRDM